MMFQTEPKVCREIVLLSLFVQHIDLLSFFTPLVLFKFLALIHRSLWEEAWKPLGQIASIRANTARIQMYTYGHLRDSPYFTPTLHVCLECGMKLELLGGETGKQGEEHTHLESSSIINLNWTQKADILIWAWLDFSGITTALPHSTCWLHEVLETRVSVLACIVSWRAGGPLPSHYNSNFCIE